jgi:hypothetical protein
MEQKHLLTRHRDIQNWITKRKGLPAIRREPDPTGSVRSRLAVRFGQARGAPRAPSLDDGMMPVSWNAWLAEFDRQGLALRVGVQENFEFVPRHELN